MTSSESRLARLVEQLRQNPGLAGQLPGAEGSIVEAALNGASVYVIAQERGISTEAVWSTLGNAARLAGGGGPAQRVEVGGLGSDTDPGVTGGYGDTGFGSLDTEPPEPINEEPANAERGTGNAE